MSNIAKIYSDLVSAPITTNVESITKEESITTEQQELKWNWLNSTVTQQVFKSIIDDENSLLDLAVNSACQSVPNHNLIQQILVRVDTLRKLRSDFSNKQTKQ